MPYNFRNAVCPWCKHEFTTLPNAEYTGYVFFDRVSDQFVDTTVCPMCGKQMILVPDKAEGIDPSNGCYEKGIIRGL